MARGHRFRLGRLLLATVAAIVLVASSWWLYRFRANCDAMCGSSRVSRALALPAGGAVPVLSTTRDADVVFVNYVTKHDPPERVRVCAELEGVLRALVSSGELSTASELFISPTYPQTRLLGWTWQGPVLSCCASVGYHAARDAQGQWNLDNTDCGGV
jgi:hypothetical protein